MGRSPSRIAPGFKDTAEFFESRAKKPKNAGRKDDFLETARFYRSLAAILPGFPAKFRTPKPSGDAWRDRAQICRAIAERIDDPERRRLLLELASTYDRGML